MLKCRLIVGILTFMSRINLILMTAELSMKKFHNPRARLLAEKVL